MSSWSSSESSFISSPPSPSSSTSPPPSTSSPSSFTRLTDRNRTDTRHPWRHDEYGSDDLAHKWHNVKLTDGKAIELIQELQETGPSSQQKVLHLRLHESFSTVYGARPLAKSIRQLPLQYLSIRGWPNPPKSTRIMRTLYHQGIQDGLLKDTLQWLEIIDDVGNIQDMIESLPVQLQGLRLKDCYQFPLLSLADCFHRDCGFHMTELSLHNSLDETRQDNVLTLFTALHSNTSLHTLRLPKNRLDDRDMKTMVLLWQSGMIPANLQVLDLCVPIGLRTAERIVCSRPFPIVPTFACGN